MGAAIAVVVGYVLGARAGKKGYAELTDAWETIRHSEDVRDLLESGLMLAKEVLGKAVGMVASNAQQGSGLRPVA